MRHENADLSPVTIERSDALDAAGALTRLAEATRKEARARRNAGDGNAAWRRSLRDAADVYDAAAKRVQRATEVA